VVQVCGRRVLRGQNRGGSGAQEALRNRHPRHVWLLPFRSRAGASGCGLAGRSHGPARLDHELLAVLVVHILLLQLSQVLLMLG
jgi:hypothetical protein